MSIKDLLNEDMKKAMKGKDKTKLSTIRMLRSQIQNQEISKGEEISDDEISELIFKEVKKLKESLEEYKSYDREDIVKNLDKEIDVLENYLPDKLTEEELIKIIEEAIKQTGAKSKSDMGVVMQEVMPKVKGKADGKYVNKLVSERL